MSESDCFPDLRHWKPVMEFTVEQAALLLAGIDPFDIETVKAAKESSHPRWKNARAHSIAIVSAIRQGLISPAICRGWQEDWNNGPYLVTIKHSDRSIDICIQSTIITRASLESWIESERVQYATPKRKAAPESIKSTPLPVTIEVIPEPLALPYYGHKSEGLEFVDEAIRQLWSTYDEEDPSTAPTQKEVIDYLRSKGAGANMADAVNLILRPANLRRGGLKTKKAPT